MSATRRHVQEMYIRICRDSGFTMHWHRAAVFAAELCDISALELWTLFGDYKTMKAIAKGEDPIVNNPEYDNRRATRERLVKQSIEEARRSTRPHGELPPEYISFPIDVGPLPTGIE